jgi:hypothetical protein
VRICKQITIVVVYKVTSTLVTLLKLIYFFVQVLLYVLFVEWVPCYHGMARHQIADGGDGLQIWRVAANILNKLSRIAYKGWPSRLVAGRGG